MPEQPYLHERLRTEFEIPLPLEVVVQELLDLRASGVETTLLEQTSDYATLSMQATVANQASHVLHVHLQRWQGTDTHVRLHGAVVTPPPPIRLSRAAVTALTTIAVGVALWMVINVLPAPIGDENAILFCFGSLGLLAAILATATGSNALLARDWYGNRRWRDQQALAGLARRVEFRLKETAAANNLSTVDEYVDLVISDEDEEMYHSR